MHYRPLSIKREGLENYLQRTAGQHNGFGYDEFLKLLEAKVPVTKLGSVFKVNRVTAQKWLNIHKDELKKAEHQTALDELGSS